MKFQPGQSGNPAGRPPGARNKKTIAAEELLGEKAKAMVERIIFLAEGGHPMALRLCMEAVMPKGADRPLALELPRVRCADDADAAFDIVIDAFGRGTLSTREFNHMLAAVGRMARTTHQIQDLRERERDRPGRKWELHPSMLPHPVPDPLEPILAAIERGEDPFPDHPGWEEGRPKGAGLHSPVNSAEAACGGAEATPEHGAADGAGLHPPVNSDAAADSATDEPADDGAPDGTEAGAGLYFPVNSGEAAGQEPTPGAAGAAPPSPEGPPATPASRGPHPSGSDEEGSGKRRADAAVDDERGTGDGAARVAAETDSGLGDVETVAIDAFGGKRDFIFRKVGHRILEVRTRVTPPLALPGTGSPPAAYPAPAAPS
jgi:hypothetical protein